MWSVVRLTLLEVRRKRLLLFSVIMTALFLVLFYLLMHLLKGAYQSGPEAVRVVAELEGGVVGESLGLFFAYFLFAFFSIFSLIGAFSGEEETQLLAVLPRPLARAEWLLGKWVANALVQAVYVGVVIAGIALIDHGLFPLFQMTLFGLAKVWLLFTLESWVLSAFTILLSVLLPPIASGIIVSSLFFIAFIGGVVEQIYSLSSKLPVGLEYAGIITSLIMPSDGLYRRALFELNGQAQSVLQSSLGPFGTSIPPSNVFIVYATGYGMVCLLLAIWRFHRKSF